MNVLKQIKYACQRLARGYDDTYLWDVSEPIAKLLIAFLKRKCVGFPMEEGMTQEKWDKIKKEILEGFEYFFDPSLSKETNDLLFIAMTKGPNSPEREEYNRRQKRYNKAKKLFAERFDDLWG